MKRKQVCSEENVDRALSRSDPDNETEKEHDSSSK